MVFIVEAGELELIKIRYNFQNEHCYHKNVKNFHHQIVEFYPKSKKV